MTSNQIIENAAVKCLNTQHIHDVADLLLNYDIDEVQVVNQENTMLGWIEKRHLYQVMMSNCDLNTSIEQLISMGVIALSLVSTLSMPKLNMDDISVNSNNISEALSYQEALVYNKQLNSVIESIHNGLVAIDNDTRIIIFNHSAELLFGMEKINVLGCIYKDVFPDGNLSEVLYQQKAAPAQKVVYAGKVLLSNRTPMMDGENTIGAIAVTQDISELEHISQELEYTKKLQAELEGIIEASFDSLVVTDEKANVLKINQSYSRWSGIDRNEIIGRNMYDLIEEGMYDRSAAALVIESQKQVTFIQNVKTGKVLFVTGTPIFNYKGKLVRVVINVRDITELNRLKVEVEKAHSLSKHYEQQLKKASRAGDMIVASPKLKEVMEVVERLGKVDSTVLVYGESGVGKELIAKELLKFSPRSDKPFIIVNCAAIPENLLESELFGYASGTFTGAQKGGKMGIFEVANGGTIFLDEIGEMPLTLQAKLLRVIQEKEVTRIGSSMPISVDVRIIAATNRDLWPMVQSKEFRADLYYRLSVVPLFIPPLRERKEDIPVLVANFVSLINQKYNMNKSIDYLLLDQLLLYHWPGNVRELKNVIERAVVTSIDDVISSIIIPGNSSGGDSNDLLLASDGQQDADIDLIKTVQLYEKTLLEKYIKKYKSSRKVAKALGVTQSMVVRKASSYGIVLNGK